MIASAGFFASAAQAAPARNLSPADFYKGRTMFVIIGYSPGGGYDLYARLLAQHLGKHIPGNPTVVSQNMPGAGSLKAANYLFSVAPKDGSTIATFARAMGIAPLIGQASFDATKFSWIGSMTRDTTLCLSWNTSPLKTWADVIAKPSTFGGEGADSDPDIFAKLYKNVFGAKIKLATGFPGTTDIGLAMQRGEVHGLCGISWNTVKAQHPDWIREKKINILIQAAPQKDAELPNVPMAHDLARSEDARRILDFVVATQNMARPFAAPPGIPEERKAVLRAAFDETLKDPAFLADARRALAEINPVSGSDVDGLVREAYATPKDIVARAARAMTN